jgi:hypothetical protein
LIVAPPPQAATNARVIDLQVELESARRQMALLEAEITDLQAGFGTVPKLAMGYVTATCARVRVGW